MREIAANKVCALIARSEIRDLVDLRALLDAGCTLERALEDAAIKDRGADAATLGYLLDQLTIGADARLPGNVDPTPAANITPSGPTTFCAGGSVTQTSNKSTAVTLNKQCGEITMNGAARLTTLPTLTTALAAARRDRRD